MRRKGEQKIVAALLKRYKVDKHVVSNFLNQVAGLVEGDPTLVKLVHSVKSRLKEPKRLRDKIMRKLKDCRERKKKFRVTSENLFVKFNDLAGLRILHLHTTQFERINERILFIIEDQKLKLIEGPVAKTWDDEYREYFKKLGVHIENNERMYTSVHYVVGSNSKTPVTCEIQVRTLSEEVWGEVDHLINYPRPTKSVACGEQIRTLARVTSSATRLVDAIFASHRDFSSRSNRGPARKAK